MSSQFSFDLDIFLKEVGDVKIRLESINRDLPDSISSDTIFKHLEELGEATHEDRVDTVVRRLCGEIPALGESSGSSKRKPLDDLDLNTDYQSSKRQKIFDEKRSEGVDDHDDFGDMKADIGDEIELFNAGNENCIDYDKKAFETIMNIIEGVNPTYVKKKLKDLGPKLSDAEFNDFVDHLLDDDVPSLPTKTDENKIQEEVARIVSMTVSDFLEDFDDPHKHFTNLTEPVSDLYKSNAIYHLRRIFPNISQRDVLASFSSNNYRFVRAARQLAGSPTGKGKSLMDPLPPRPIKPDTGLLLELVYYLLADKISDCQRVRRDRRRRQLETARALKELVECEKCQQEQLLTEVASCSEGHVLCKCCLRLLADTEAMTCPGGLLGPSCDGVLSLAALRPLLPHRLVDRLEKRSEVLCHKCGGPCLVDGRLVSCQRPSCSWTGCSVCGGSDHGERECQDDRGESSTSREASQDERLAVVVDTCALIDDLKTIQVILRQLVPSERLPKIFIPWRVMCELDKLKDKGGKIHIRPQVRDAISWINTSLQKQDPNIVGQTALEEKKSGEMFVAHCGDDQILQLCLHLKMQRDVLLVTNDKNLASKSIIHKITTASTRKENVLQKIEDMIRN